MAVLKIEQINEYGEHILKDVENNKEYSFILEFHNCESAVGDTLVLNDCLLDINNQEYSRMYSFGAPNSKYGRQNPSVTELAMLKKGNEYIKLKRIYG